MVALQSFDAKVIIPKVLTLKLIIIKMVALMFYKLEVWQNEIVSQKQKLQSKYSNFDTIFLCFVRLKSKITEQTFS